MGKESLVNPEICFAEELPVFQAEGNDTNLYYIDFVSIGKNAREDKLLDCLDLAEILCSEEFIYEPCAPNGKPNYMCPALQSLYPKLAKLGSSTMISSQVLLKDSWKD